MKIIKSFKKEYNEFKKVSVVLCRARFTDTYFIKVINLYGTTTFKYKIKKNAIDFYNLLKETLEEK